MRPRPFSYSQIVTLPAGGQETQGLCPLTQATFASQFPFELRDMTIVAPVLGWLVRLRGPQGELIDSDYVGADQVTGGLPMQQAFRETWPPILYPAGSVITLDAMDASGAGGAMEVIYRGVHYVPDSFDAYRPPAKFKYEWISYVTLDTIAPVAAGGDIPQTIDGDGDFLLMGVRGWFDPGFGAPVDLRLQIKDQNGRAYSNTGLPMNQAMSAFWPTFPFPYWPPIGILRNGAFLRNWVRNDALGAPARMHLEWIGARIQEVC